MDMAERMADRETLCLPLAQFEEREALVTALQAEDLLMRSENGRSVRFRHQTRFEHARARAFARSEGSLAAHALERQDGLFVRPLVWSSLNYLRGADDATCQREMGKLWGERQEQVSPFRSCFRTSWDENRYQRQKASGAA